jgi:putative transposase
VSQFTKQPDFSILDLRAHFRGLKYVAETLSVLPQKPGPIVTQQIAAKIVLFGVVNATSQRRCLNKLMR